MTPDSSELPAPALTDEATTLERLRAGDEGAFTALIDAHHASLARLARTYVDDAALVEEIAQDTWIGFLESLPRSEGRASIKTWLFRILMNVLRSRLRKESRTVPFSALFDADAPDEPAVDPGRFERRWFSRRRGEWTSPPARWESQPEEQALGAETRAAVQAAVAELPPSQREVITLRDIEGFGAEEVCNLLGISDTNQRVLLHRARSKVRRALEAHIGTAPGMAKR
jgi:RNA polymerase sigma-70 factor (ECF subfamily)